MAQIMNDQESKGKILVVDDEPVNVRLLRAILQTEGYTPLEASSGAEALKMAREHDPDVILLDVMMPDMDGFEVTRYLKADPDTAHIPVLLVTALADRRSRLQGLEIGAEDYLTKPVDRTEVLMRVKNFVRLKNYQNLLKKFNNELAAESQEKTAQIWSSNIEAIFILCRAAEHKDTDTGQHIERISRYCSLMAEHLNLGHEFADRLYYASPMHDVGKIGVPDLVLLKPGGFTPEEWRIMQSHAQLGWEILKDADSPYLRMGAEIALGHHERWDGTGYPEKKKGEAIPLAARIVNICDQYDALRSPRPYKPPFPHEKAAAILTEGDGRTLPSHFDPDVLQAFLQLAPEFRAIYDSMSD